MVNQLGSGVNKIKLRSKTERASFTDTARKKVRERVAQVNTLNQINSQGLVPFYQPIVDKDGNHIKSEVLVRSFGKNGEIMMPEEILKVSLVETADLFFDFYRKALYEGVQNGVTVCLNFPSAYLKGERFEEFIEFVKLIGGEHFLAVEILETDAELDKDVLKNLHRIRKIGIKISLDDFLSKNSNAERIQLLMPDFVKFDGRVAQTIEGNIFMQNFLTPVIQGIKNCGMKTIAEHVETQEQFEILKRMGFDYYQGFLFGRPKKEMSV